MKTAVVILNWNTEGFLKEFLPSLVQSAAEVEGAEVVVADNASTDGSMKVMAELFPHVKTIALDRNYGFTGGYNKAFEALEKDGFTVTYVGVDENGVVDLDNAYLGPVKK